MKDKMEKQQGGEARRRHFTEPRGHGEQQSQQGGDGRQQGGFPHEQGGWGMVPEEEAAGAPAHDRARGPIEDAGLHRDPRRGRV